MIFSIEFDYNTVITVRVHYRCVYSTALVSAAFDAIVPGLGSCCIGVALATMRWDRMLDMFLDLNRSAFPPIKDPSYIIH